MMNTAEYSFKKLNTTLTELFLCYLVILSPFGNQTVKIKDFVTAKYIWFYWWKSTDLETWKNFKDYMKSLKLFQRFAQLEIYIVYAE